MQQIQGTNKKAVNHKQIHQENKGEEKRITVKNANSHS